jgi:hypothetical protein
MIRALILIALCGLSGLTQAREFYCQAMSGEEPNPLMQWGDLVLEEAFFGGQCHLRVLHAHDATPEQFRNFAFSESGQIYIYSEFDNPYNPLSTFATSGTKGYFIFPRVTQLKAVYDELRDEFHIRLPSGERIYFKHSPLAIDETRTRDLEISQSPVAYDNAGGISIRNPRGVLLNIGYAQGGSESVRKALILEDGYGRTCALPHRRLFDYFRKSYLVSTGKCPSTIPASCRCNDRGKRKERMVCDNERQLAYSQINRRSVDGYKPKPNIEAIIEASCPSLHSLTLARNDTRFLLEELSPRLGQTEPPLATRGKERTVQTNNTTGSGNILDDLRALFN